MKFAFCSLQRIASILTLASILLPVGSLLAFPAYGASSQSHAEIRETATRFVQEQTRAIPGKVSIQVADIDSRITLPACPVLEAFLLPGTQLNGNSNVGVRCINKHNWTLFVQVAVKISTNVLTSNKNLLQGQIVREEDINVLSTESLQSGALNDPRQAIGKLMRYGVAAGQILRQDMLRAPYTVKQGQAVQLQVSGAGFKVSSEGQALANAAEGETASARTAAGQIVSGIVKDGAIVVHP